MKIKGQVQVSWFVLLILALFLMYIFFLPPESREKLFENETNQSEEPSKALLSVSPGLLYKIGDNKIDHYIPNVFLFKRIEGKELFYFPSLTVFRTLFLNKHRSISFSLEKPNKISKVYLTFNIEKCKGILDIMLNDQFIYSGEFNEGSINPIEINPSILRENNTLKFEIASIPIFSRYYYYIKDIKIAGDIVDDSNLVQSSSFYINDEEYNNIERLILSFIPMCNQNNVKRMKININNHLVYEGIPSCDSPISLELDKSILQRGYNKIEFSLEDGAIKIEQIKIRTMLKERKNPIYYFDISEEEYENIKDKKIVVSFDFGDHNRNKELRVIVNGYDFYIETEENIYEYDITSFIKEGSNYIEIVPYVDSLYIYKIEIYVK